MRTTTNDRNVSRRRILEATTAVAVSGALAGCTGGDGGETGNGTSNGTSTGTGTETPMEVTMGAPKVAAAGVSPRVAVNQGYAKQRNLDLTLELAAPPALFTQLQGKKLESSTFPVISGARLANQGGKIRLIQPHTRSFNSIIARKGAGLSNVKDLQDITLGSMPKKTAPFTHFALLLKLKGINLDEYEFQFSPPPALFGAMKQGKLDAMIGVEPFSTRLLASGEYKEFFAFNEVWKEMKGSDMPLVEVATYQTSLDEKPDAFKALARALQEAGKYITDNPVATFEEYSDVLGLETQKEIQMAADRIAPIYPTEFSTDLRKSGKEIVRLAAEKGLLEKKPPIDEMFVKPDNL